MPRQSPHRAAVRLPAAEVGPAGAPHRGGGACSPPALPGAGRLLPLRPGRVHLRPADHWDAGASAGLLDTAAGPGASCEKYNRRLRERGSSRPDPGRFTCSCPALKRAPFPRARPRRPLTGADSSYSGRPPLRPAVPPKPRLSRRPQPHLLRAARAPRGPARAAVRRRAPAPRAYVTAAARGGPAPTHLGHVRRAPPPTERRRSQNQRRFIGCKSGSGAGRAAAGGPPRPSRSAARGPLARACPAATCGPAAGRRGPTRSAGTAAPSAPQG